MSRVFQLRHDREKYWLGHSPGETRISGASREQLHVKILLTIVLKYYFELDVSGRIGTG